MRNFSITIILFFLFLTSLNCRRSKTIAELMNTFSHSKLKLDAIVSNIQGDKILDSLFFEIGPENGLPDIKTSYPKQYAMLREVGITDASAHKGACPQITIFTEEQEIAAKAGGWRKAHFKRKWFYLKTDWQSDHPIFLIYNECDTAKTRKGLYDKDEYQNETWGLGGNWAMFRLVKYIEVKQ